MVDTNRNVDTRLLRYRQNPASEDAPMLANDLLELDRAADVLSVTGIALRRAPDQALLLLFEGRAHLRLGDLVQAQASLLKAARLLPKQKEPFRWLGDVLLKRGDPERAAKVLQHANEIDPEDTEIQLLLERAYRLARVAQDPESTSNFSVPPEQTITVHVSEETVRSGSDATHVATTKDIPLRSAKSKPSPESENSTERHPIVSEKSSLANELTLPTDSISSPVVEPLRDSLPFDDQNTLVSSAKSLLTMPTNSSEPATHANAKISLQEEGVPTLNGDSEKNRYETPNNQGKKIDSTVSEWNNTHSQHTKVSHNDEQSAVETINISPKKSKIYDPKAEPRLPARSTDGVNEDAQILSAAESMKHENKPSTSKRSRKAPIMGIFVVTLCIGCLAALFWGWNEWGRRKHQKANQYIESSLRLAHNGSHTALVTAEKQLRLAQDMYPKNSSSWELLLLVQSEQVLEEGRFESSLLRQTVARAKHKTQNTNAFHVASAIICATDKDFPQLEAHLNAIKHGAHPYAALTEYLIGRLGQKLGLLNELSYLTNVLKRPDPPAAALIAIAESRLEEGKPDEALQVLRDAQHVYPNHLRAQLWEKYISSRSIPNEAIFPWMEQTEPLVHKSAPTDQMLFFLIKSKLGEQNQDTQKAIHAVSLAARTGVSDPRLLMILADRAHSLGLLTIAQQSAAQALAGAPNNTEYRKTYASICLERHEGSRALTILDSISHQDPETIKLLTEAAIQVGTKDRLSTALYNLDSILRKSPSDTQPHLRALRIRALLGLRQTEQALREVKPLQNRFPDEGMVSIAAGEVALAMGNKTDAESNFAKALSVNPNQVDALWGQARIFLSKGRDKEAVQVLKHVIELSSEYIEARVLLADLYIQRGNYEAALPIYEEIEKSNQIMQSGPAADLGRRGVILSLIEMRKTSEAKSKITSLNAPEKESAYIKSLMAQILFIEGDINGAIALLGHSEESDISTWMVKGEIARYIGRFEESKGHFDSALSQKPRMITALVGRLLSDAESGEVREAQKRVPTVESVLHTSIASPRVKAEFGMALAIIDFFKGNRNLERNRTLLKEAINSRNAPVTAWYWLALVTSAKYPEEAHSALKTFIEHAPYNFFLSRAQAMLAKENNYVRSRR